jgi:hypothetical protein
MENSNNHKLETTLPIDKRRSGITYFEAFNTK